MLICVHNIDLAWKSFIRPHVCVLGKKTDAFLRQIARTHGGMEAVASLLGMQIHYSSKLMHLGQSEGKLRVGAPGKGYSKWGEVEQAVLSLAQTLCAPDTMPSYMAMRSAGLAPLADAVRKQHGGLQNVADRLGLQLPSAFSA